LRNIYAKLHSACELVGRGKLEATDTDAGGFALHAAFFLCFWRMVHFALAFHALLLFAAAGFVLGGQLFLHFHFMNKWNV